MNWITEHEPLLGLALQALMAIIWIAYLQLFLLGYLQQRRPMVLINRGAGVGDEARCLVSNMGAEPIYLLSIVAEVTAGEDTLRAFVTDREEIEREDLAAPSDATTRGPMDSGSFVDVGSFNQLLCRAMRHVGRDEDIEKVTHLDLTVLFGSGHSMLLVGGRRHFIVGRTDGERRFVPLASTTEQITRRSSRHRLRRILEDNLREEAGALDQDDIRAGSLKAGHGPG